MRKNHDETKYFGISILFGGHFSINKYIFYNCMRIHGLLSEPKFINPGAQESMPVRPPHLKYRHAKLIRLAESIPWNRFLGSINVSKFGLWHQRIMIHINLFLVVSTENPWKEGGREGGRKGGLKPRQKGMYRYTVIRFVSN
jgi:hypothetical protein